MEVSQGEDMNNMNCQETQNGDSDSLPVNRKPLLETTASCPWYQNERFNNFWEHYKSAMGSIARHRQMERDAKTHHQMAGYAATMHQYYANYWSQYFSHISNQVNEPPSNVSRKRTTVRKTPQKVQRVCAYY